MLFAGPRPDEGIVLDNMAGGLYQLINNPAVDPASVFAVTQVSSRSLWHMRLGHVPSNILLKIPELDVPHSVCSDSCNICPLDKHCRLPFSLSQSHTLLFLNFFIVTLGSI